MPLSFAAVGERCCIRKISGREDSRRHLESLGFTPGESVLIVSRMGGNIILSVRGSRVAVSAEMAAKIII
ncbi:MAG: ferrous iron transport protein A [Clostridiales bacterium]|nr:ferrous iron transport protein A [Clostridiales bacterium]